MGDNKRNSVAGKVATPKTGGSSPAMQPLSDPLETLGKAIGARIKITTIAPHSQTLEGSLFTADPVLNLIAINTRASNPGDYHIIPVSKVQSLQIVSLPTEGDGSFATAQPPIGPIDTRQLKRREEDRVNQLKEQEQNRGKGVSREAQAIFDALHRIGQHVRWHNEQIIVHDSVIIAPPYRPEDVKGLATKPDNVARVKRMLEDQRKKLALEGGRKGTPTGPRKGG